MMAVQFYEQSQGSQFAGNSATMAGKLLSADGSTLRELPKGPVVFRVADLLASARVELDGLSDAPGRALDCDCDCDWIGLDWIGLDRIGSDWIRLGLGTGTGRIGLHWIRLDR